MSGLFIPLEDDEGVVGILVLESARAEFATPRQQELATILAHQATVALRNAQLYNQVPLADALGALQARKQALLAMPHRRRMLIAGAVLIAVGSLLASPVQNAASRAVEARADRDSLEVSGEPQVFEDMQVQLSLRSLSDPTPPAWSQFWFGSHPTTLQRIGMARAMQ